MHIRPREVVILAHHPAQLVDWYRDTLGFEIVQQFDEDYHYTYMQTSTGIKIGIGSAAEMGVAAPPRNQNTVLLQFEVDDVPAFFTHLETKGSVVSFGPSFDPKGQFWFGGFTDLEGNPIWVVDRNCP